MRNYQHLHRNDFKWTTNPFGFEVCRQENGGVVMTIVRGKKGQQGARHRHSLGAFAYVVSGKIEIDGEVLTAGDVGWGGPGGDGFSVLFLEHSEYIVSCSSVNKTEKT